MGEVGRAAPGPFVPRAAAGPGREVPHRAAGSCADTRLRPGSGAGLPGRARLPRLLASPEEAVRRPPLLLLRGRESSREVSLGSRTVRQDRKPEGFAVFYASRTSHCTLLQFFCLFVYFCGGGSRVCSSISHSAVLVTGLASTPPHPGTRAPPGARVLHCPIVFTPAQSCLLFSFSCPHNLLCRSHLERKPRPLASRSP